MVSIYYKNYSDSAQPGYLHMFPVQDTLYSKPPINKKHTFFRRVKKSVFFKNLYKKSFINR